MTIRRIVCRSRVRVSGRVLFGGIGQGIIRHK